MGFCPGCAGSWATSDCPVSGSGITHLQAQHPEALFWGFVLRLLGLLEAGRGWVLREQGCEELRRKLQAKHSQVHVQPLPAGTVVSTLALGRTRLPGHTQEPSAQSRDAADTQLRDRLPVTAGGLRLSHLESTQGDLRLVMPQVL